MSHVEKHNPLKKDALSQKRDSLKDGGRVDIPEITFETVKEDAIRFGLVTDVHYQMNAGKEASIFLAEWKGHAVILKAYRLWHSSHQLSKTKGFIPVGTSKRSYCVYDMMANMAVVEYDLLINCFKAGMHVPTPIGRVGTYVTMRFIGDDFEPAPQLKDAELQEPEVVFEQILDDYLIMYRDVHYVHADLSEYNILWWQNRPWIIDVPQGYKVDTHCNMNKAEALLRRDIRNVMKYFESYGIHKDEEHILEAFLDSYIPHNKQHYRELLPQGGELL